MIHQRFQPINHIPHKSKMASIVSQRNDTYFPDVSSYNSFITIQDFWSHPQQEEDS